MKQVFCALFDAYRSQSGRLRKCVLICAAVLPTALSPAPKVLAGVDAGRWVGQLIPDPTHRGGSISEARTTMSLHGGASLDAWVRCWTATDLLDTRFILRDYPSALSGAVSWQFDRSAVQAGTWRVTWSGDAVVVPNAIQEQFLQDMRERRTLRLKLKDVGQEQIDIVLSLTGSNRPLARVTRSCG